MAIADSNVKINFIRARFDERCIVVYQAYNQIIAGSAVERQTFVSPPFKKERMTWIKPSFLWMMYRSGWASKKNQESILAIKIERAGFEWALDNSCLSHFDSTLHNSPEDWKNLLSKSPVRIQWDPERSIFLQSLEYKSIQIGLRGEAVERFISDWIVQIEDITQQCKKIHKLIFDEKIKQAHQTLPLERFYPLPIEIARKIGASY